MPMSLSESDWNLAGEGGVDGSRNQEEWGMRNRDDLNRSTAGSTQRPVLAGQTQGLALTRVSKSCCWVLMPR